MRLRDFLAPEDILLDLKGTTKFGALQELTFHLGLRTSDASGMLRILERREALGSTGIGRGVAIPHCRTHLVPRLRVVFGRAVPALPWDAIDGQPVSNIFLLVAPPIEVSNDYLPVLGRIAEFVKAEDTPARLAAVTTAAELLELLDERGA
ncbi:MAG: PTS sugar transporter subunit IIA [Gemmatimonadales bacterium]|nr:PTS sugar transporter subunit IIA [Gemmatimonadales bacterium]